jgi:hypothetical protein
MAKRKGTREQTNIFKTPHRKLTIKKYELLKTGDEPRCPGKVHIYCSDSDTVEITKM